jgi:hypothetical protein
VHFRRARVGEAHVDPAGDERPDQRLRSVHRRASASQQVSRRGCRG